MFKHAYLSDPIERTDDMKVEAFSKYTEINRVEFSTKPELVKEIKTQFFEFAESAKVDEAMITKLWGFVGTKIKENPGLANFTLDYNGAKSNFFFPWLINIFRSPATALEMSYGAGTDLHGNWIRNVPENDPIDYFVRNDPTFVYNRERQLYLANLASCLRDVAFDSDEKKKIVDFGAGMLAWVRWHGFVPQPHQIEIYAYDKDPSIRPETLFPGEDLEALGIRYKHGDLMVQVRNHECDGADLAILGGVASYIPPDIFAEKVVKAIYALLNHGGIFFYDLQVKCPYLERSMSIFDWPTMYLADNVETAIKNVEKVRRRLWREGLKFAAEYAVDTYNENPSAVMIMLQKV
ncbi:hypothetical protein IJG93_00575 [Candidatus Saccharibacteria bacterium]|nr:hypothetical protein [Candidatus Saccharibacteria bacterium]